MTSIVASIFATSAGLRKPAHTTMCPRRTRDVTRGEGGQRGERFEGDLVGRVGERLEVVEQPDRLEAERLRLPGDLNGPLPGGRRIHAVVLAGPALGDDDPDLHGALPSRLAASRANWSYRLDRGRMVPRPVTWRQSPCGRSGEPTMAESPGIRATRSPSPSRNESCRGRSRPAIGCRRNGSWPSNSERAGRWSGRRSARSSSAASSRSSRGVARSSAGTRARAGSSRSTSNTAAAGRPRAS